MNKPARPDLSNAAWHRIAFKTTARIFWKVELENQAVPDALFLSPKIPNLFAASDFCAGYE
jgi:hypothetical protein